MSGGHFNGAQYRVDELAREIEEMANDIDVQRAKGFGDLDFSAETSEAFRDGARLLRMAYVYAQRIDYLVSGDDGESTFHQRLKADLGRLVQ